MYEEKAIYLYIGIRRNCGIFIHEVINREFTQRQEYDYDYVNGCLKGLGLIVIVIVIVSLNVGLR